MNKKLMGLILISVLAIPALCLAAGSNVRIELERETREKVKIAVTPFVLEANYEDASGLGGESRKILENDLSLSELFDVVPDRVYSTLLSSEAGKTTVDYVGWGQVGVQWLLKTEYKVNPLDKSFNVTFRIYETATEKFLIGKRYTTTEKYLRKIIHRFADEVVLQLTGKRGVAETRIAYLSRVGQNKEIFVVDFDGENLRKLTDDQTVILTPAWSPDGAWIVYTSFADHNPDLVMVRSSGQLRRRTLLKLPGLNAAPSWGPDGNRIALVLSKDQNSEIYVLEKNYGLKRMTRHFNIDTSPTWSPDGKKIAFTSDRSGTGSPQIYILEVDKGDTGGVKRISFGSTYNDNPAWSPDGDKIAFTSRIGRRFQIMLYDLNTRKTEQFTVESGSNEQPAWSPDGRFIVYRNRDNGREQIMIKGLQHGSKPRQLSFADGGGYSPAWSPYFKKP